MASTYKNDKKDFKFTQDEVKRIGEAMKDEQFVKLMADYARELNDPAKKALYESEIIQLEQDRGFEVSFIHPKPGYVIKVEEKGTRNKIFINICSEPQIEAPASVSTYQDGLTGLKWSIPYSLSKPRDDLDRSGSGCVVYDAIFHPDTLYLASRDTRIKNLVHNTAFDALKTSFKVEVDTNQVKYPKMKFKGVFHPTVLRKQKHKNINSENMDTESNQKETEMNAEVVKKKVENDYIIPDYSIKYRNKTDLQDYVLNIESVGSCRPKQMIVEISLPQLDSAAHLDLDVQERSLSLVRENLPKHKLHLDLPFPVDENSGNAKFDKSKKCLVVSLPIKPAPMVKTERLSSNDSGIEEDTMSAPKMEVESSHKSAKTKVDKNNEKTDSVKHKQGEKINKKEGYRTGKCEGDNISNNQNCDNKDIGDAAIVDTGETESASTDNDKTNENNAGDVTDHLRTKVGFLDSDISYCLPVFTHTVLDNTMIITLEVKNVAEHSVEHTVGEQWKFLHFKFASIGAGQFAVHYAFYIDFMQSGSLLDDINVECWDNNVVLQFPFNQNMTRFKVGVCSSDMKEKEFTAQISAPITLSLQSDEKKPTKGLKYTHEKHPKLFKKHNREKKACDGESEKVEEVDTLMDTSNSTRDRHSSDESMESSMSVSPYDTILLEQQHLKHMAEVQQTDNNTAAESDADEPNLVIKRSISTEEGMLAGRPAPRSILKRKSVPTLPGSRFRCYSESCADVGSSVAGSVTPSHSQSTISEEGESVEKKSVRFSEKIQQQLYRINSCIIPKTAKNRKKAMKRRQAIERRLSEGDSVDLVENQAVVAGGSLDSNIWEQESHEDSGLSSSFEEGLVITAQPDKQKTKKRTKKRTKTFEMSNDLIFDLDI